MFLNPIMLVFLGAAVVPVVLHLLSRSRQTTVRWGAMMFLEEASPRRAALRRLREAMVLVMRCAALALLALALARPVGSVGEWAGGKPGGGGAWRLRSAGLSPGAVVVVVDVSGSTGASVGAAGGGGATRLDAVKEAAVRVVAGLRAGDVVAVLPGGAGGGGSEVRAAELFTADRGVAAARIAALRSSSARTDLEQSLTTAARLLRTPAAGGERVKMIAVVTDRQGSTYSGFEGDAGDRIGRRFAGLRTGAGGAGGGEIRVVFVPAGGAAAGDRDNVYVSRVEVAPASTPVGGAIDGGPVLRGVPVEVRVTVRNDGVVPGRGLTVRVGGPGVLFGQAVGEGRGTVDLAPDSEGVCRVPAVFPTAGRVVLTVTAGAASGTARASGAADFDDTVSHVVEVAEAVPVLVVVQGGGGGGAELVGGPAAVALAPFDGAGEAAGGAVGDAARVTLALPSRTDGPAGPRSIPAFGLSAFRVVVVPQLTRLSDTEAAAIRQFVYGGGGLVAGVGPLTEEATLRKLADVLPARVGAPTPAAGPRSAVVAVPQTAGPRTDDGRPAEAPTDHPALAYTRQSPANPPNAATSRATSPGGPLPGAVVSRRRTLQAKDGAAPPTVVLGAKALGGTAGPEPLLVEGRYGEGTVLLMAVPLEGPWWNGPASVGYLPFVQSAVRYCAARGAGEPGGARANVEAGAVLSWDLPGDVDVRSVAVEAEAGGGGGNGGGRFAPEVVRGSASGVTARWGPAHSPGVYTLRYRSGGKDHVLPVAVKPDPRESALGSNDAAVARAAEVFAAEVRPDATGPATDAPDPAALRHGREWWPHLLAAALACLLGELWATRRL